MIEDIRRKIVVGQFEYSKHAADQSILRRITVKEMQEAIANAEIIEDYPDDKYSPSCLIYGRSKAGRHLHVQLSLPPTVVIITAYEPDESEWIDFRVRRKKK